MSEFSDKLAAFRGRRVLVVGLGRSGVGAAKVLAPVAARVVASDQRPLEELDPTARRLSKFGVELRGGDQGPALLEQVDLLVRSPGVPWAAPLVAAAREAGVEVIGELELAYRLLVTDRIVAVTGSNGKSTTTALLGEMFRRAGEEVVVAGNIGVALTAVLAELEPTTTVVAEVSSFQLEDVATFKPHVAVLLNLAPDHLDRHGSPAAYYRMKWRIFENQGAGDYAVLNADDPSSAKADNLRAAVTLFGRRAAPGPGVWLEGGDVKYDVRGRRGTLLAASGVRLPGPHNLSNAMAAACASLAVGVPAAAVAEALASFEGLPHRLEFTGEVARVRYVNDSKATNVASALAALASFDGPIVLIAGGKSKGEDFAALASAARGKVRAAILYGAAQEELAAAFAGVVPLERAATVKEAVAKAVGAARPGDTVLLSPACTSWDQYRDFEERGDDFKRAVADLSRGAG
ncbi:MAG: UDP-N-acetylmuramoyl-L-alanine--D-glutamate ligase [candidate division Zixibacteria bacterium]|nr:UDP-N-acetylmuramoyl-L-alanine--D-glutamate ligase [candidate division Zixibacteria bacterium]